MDHTPDETAWHPTRGFASQWLVYQDYQISEEVIQPHGEVAYTYDPVVRAELPQEIAKLQWGNTTLVRHFVKEYGLLGYGALIHRPCAGDPLLWLWTHAKTIRLCFDLTSLLQKQDIDTVQEALRTLTFPATTQNVTLKDRWWPSALVACRENSLSLAWDETAWQVVTSLTAPGDMYGIHPDCEEPEEVFQLARRIRRDLINENIASLQCRLVEHPEKEHTGFGFRAMIEMAYWHLAQIVAKKRVEYCLECGAAFAQTTRRQQFCPPNKHRQESTCAVRRRVKKHLKKIRLRDSVKEI